MMLGAPDVVTDVVQKFQGKAADYGITGIPDGKASLTGGEAYMINPGGERRPDQGGHAVDRLRVQHPSRGRFGFAHVRQASGEAVGVPNNATTWVTRRPARPSQKTARRTRRSVENYEAYVESATGVALKLEPAKAQELYAVLDVAMSAVLTRENADIDKLLSDAESKANSILAKS
ncbi:hypothetical protein [Streptomyces sp. KL116D]|uniref:hypothetical protein n=1 Tax=Streptomyces sp. KL116D TaxID=3045152 RepID=UPI0035592C93